MSVFSRFQMRKKWALFDANQFPQPLAIMSAITFAGVDCLTQAANVGIECGDFAVQVFAGDAVTDD